MDGLAGDDLVEPGSAREVGGVTIELDALDDASLGSRALTLLVREDGEPIAEGTLVYLTIRMPTMDHGVSAYPAIDLGEGRYRAERVSLGMGGEWVVSVEVIRQARAPISVPYRLLVTEA